MTELTQDITAIAKKQRYLALLGKVKEGQGLTAAELNELQRYETKVEIHTEPRLTRAKRSKRKFSQAESQRLGFECKDIGEADSRSGIQANLTKYFGRHPRLRAAFDRGRLLRYLVELAPKAMIYEAARRLKDLGFTQFETGQNLREFLDGDAEANELWESARVNGWIENREALRKTAAEGNVQAIKLMDKWAVDRQQEMGEPVVNFNRIGVNQMAAIFGTTRQSIHEWYTTKGLPQNADGSFDLYRAIAWFEEFTLKKATRGREAISLLNPFQAVKTERERLRLEQDRGELIERGAVIGFQVTQMTNLVNAFNAIADLANRLFGQPREEIVARLEEFRDEVMAKLQHIPAELKLSTEAEAKLVEFYEVIKPRIDEKGKTNEESKKMVV